MKNILFLNDVSIIAGAEMVILRLVENIDRTRYVPLVLTPPGPLAGKLAKRGIVHIPYTFKMRRLKTGKPGTSGRLTNPLALLQKVLEGFEIARLARAHRVDLIHAHAVSPYISGLVAGRLLGLPVIWHIHNIHPRIMYRIVLPEKLIFVSRGLRDRTFPKGIPSKAIVIYNGQDFSVFNSSADGLRDLRDRLGFAKAQPLAGYVARLAPPKRHRVLLDAWYTVSRESRDARLLIVGDEVTEDGSGFAGSYRTELEHYACNLGIAESVVFTGFMDDIPRLLNAIDVYVHPAEPEQFGLSVLEAMAMSKPVVAARSSGVVEIMGQPPVGILVEPGDSAGLAQAIIRLINHPELRRQLGEAGRLRALSEFSAARQAEQVQAVYDDLLGQSG